MNKIARRTMSIGAAVALAVGGMVAAAPAFAAAIPGCSFTTVGPSLSGSYIHWGGSAACSNSGTARTRYTRLYHNYDNWPDYQVNTNFDIGSKTSYSAVLNQCDGGGTTQYYDTVKLSSEFDPTGSTKTSGTYTLTHC